jgi:hypothetical protein
MSEINCDGSILSGYDCIAPAKCCNVPASLDSCLDLGGDICSSSEICQGGTIFEASDTSFGESCCIGGSCNVPATLTECESNGGSCRSFGCETDEDISSDSCDDSGLTCCVQKTSSDKNYTWLWIFLILIILVIVAIIFRDKLRPLWFKLKSKFKKGKSSGSGIQRGPGGFPPRPMPGRPIPRRPVQRKILPPSQRRALPKQSSTKKPGELDSVLKKLKEMSK